MALQPPTSKVQCEDDTEALHWLQPDPSYYKLDQVSYKALQVDSTEARMSNTSSATAGHDQWTVPLYGWQAVIGNTHLSNTTRQKSYILPSTGWNFWRLSPLWKLDFFGAVYLIFDVPKNGTPALGFFSAHHITQQLY
ncbi:hypothetical protein BC835DRAFT_15791 [Cytidiella melzeri]|nr:hypothetical protein BC835DRAFT_15791 [Cytidiella melzeri]